ncbi:MAG: sugar ABC transporter ATP-binding protein [Chloroflexi bacterium]|nr:sugar ABC transporter ATP-binding protein [Chloroflexota bacterium]
MVTSLALVELEHVVQRYGQSEVLSDVSLTLWPGEVVGLIGDNGSGKSTLLKIIAGYQPATDGVVRVMGQPIRLRNPGQARALGIEPVYQDLAILDDLCLWRNFFLGKERRRGRFGLGLLDTHWMRTTCEAQLREVGLTRIESADMPARLLSGGERQALAVTRAVYFGARVLLLDEPTASLSARETANVLRAITGARQRGLGVLYIDHNLRHVLPVADRIIVLEHGRIVGEVRAGEVTEDELQRLIAPPFGDT